MTKPLKFRYVSQISGLFVLIALGVVAVAVILAGHAQGWFEPVYRLRLAFPPEGSFDLQKGAEVRILGALVGNVESISVDEEGNMTGVITVRGNFIRFVREDSRAIAKKKFGVAGDAYVEITKGTGAPLPEGATLTCIKDTELIELIGQVVDEIRSTVTPTIEKIHAALDAYTGLAQTLQDPKGSLQQFLGQLNELAAALNRGEGPAGRLLRDPELSEELSGIVKRVNANLDQVRRILEDVQQISGAVRDESRDLGGALLQGREALEETERLLEALQRHWLLRRYVTPRAPTERISETAVAGAAP